jgi:hypothetical protein
MKEPEVLYEFIFCWCIHESAYQTISIHRTKEGAIAAMNLHKKVEHEDSKYNKDKRWDIRQIIIQP